MEQKHIFVIAGESSGDQHAANYIKEHKKLNTNHQFSAIGQQELAKVGVDLIFNSESISVVGIMEVISKYGKIRKALKGSTPSSQNPYPNNFPPAPLGRD